MINILFFGGRGCGKTTVTNILTNEFPHTTEIRLADYVVNACKAFGIDNPTREDLVRIGTDIGRNQISKRVWIDQALKDIKLEPKMNHIISDVRFDNEYEIFFNEGFFPVLIDCDLETRVERVIKRDGKINYELLNHESEQNYKRFKPLYILDNNGTFDDLYKEIEEMFIFVNYWRG